MAISIEQFEQNFAQHCTDNVNTSIRNYADMININMRKCAPFLTGALVKSCTVQQNGDGYDIVSTVPYAIRRNFENRLHPQTLHYVERGVELTKAGTPTQWWKAINP